MKWLCARGYHLRTYVRADSFDRVDSDSLHRTESHKKTVCRDCGTQTHSVIITEIHIERIQS